MLISQQIAHYLTFQGIGRYAELGIDGNIFIDALPEGENLIGIYNRRSGSHNDSKLGYNVDGIQIIYRGNKNPIQSIKKAQEIFEALHGFSGFIVNFNNLTWGNAKIEWGLLRATWGGESDMWESWIVSCLSPNGRFECVGMNKNREYEYSMNFTIDYKK